MVEQYLWRETNWAERARIRGRAHALPPQHQRGDLEHEATISGPERSEKPPWRAPEARITGANSVSRRLAGTGPPAEEVPDAAQRGTAHSRGITYHRIRMRKARLASDRTITFQRGICKRCGGTHIPADAWSRQSFGPPRSCGPLPRIGFTPFFRDIVCHSPPILPGGGAVSPLPDGRRSAASASSSRTSCPGNRGV